MWTYKTYKNTLGKSKNLSTTAYMHSALWYNEGIKVVGDYMDAEWDMLP